MKKLRNICVYIKKLFSTMNNFKNADYPGVKEQELSDLQDGIPESADPSPPDEQGGESMLGGVIAPVVTPVRPCGTHVRRVGAGGCLIIGQGRLPERRHPWVGSLSWCWGYFA